MSNEYRHVELLTGDVRRRRWATEQKLTIIEQSFDIGILLRLSGLDVAQAYSLRFDTLHQFATDVLRPIIHTNGERFAAPFDDLVQTADDAFSRQRKVLPRCPAPRG